MNKEKLYSVKEVCDKYNITRKTLFYYDQIGLLIPTERQGKQQFKYYNHNALSRLETILEYRRVGLTINEIKEIIDLNNKKLKLEILLRAKERLEGEAKQKQEEIALLDVLIEEVRR